MMEKTEEQKAIDAAYEAGVDSLASGPDAKNCHFKHFATHERTDAWQRGFDKQLELEGAEE